MTRLNPLQLAFDFLSGLKRPEPIPRPSRVIAEQHTPQPVEADPAYELRRHPRRRTLSIEVHADLRVIVRAPARYPGFEIEAFVSERRAWIAAQLEHFRLQTPRLVRPLLRYTAGEAHTFLGRSYCLDLRPHERTGVALIDERIVVSGRAANTAGGVERALARWYRARAEQEFERLVDLWHGHPRFARYPRPALNIRSMRSRWGSLGTRRGMTLNLVLIQAPIECVEYVVVHELCHLRYHGHGRGFYRLLESVLPDWRSRKKLLEATIP
jgi:predicted metal-dependent hydrolase